MNVLRVLATSVLVVLPALPALAAELVAELVMVEEPGCVWCAQWNAQLAPIYPKTPEGQFAPLRRVELRDTRKGTTGITFARPVLFTPTFVLIEDGVELGRIEGYPGEDFFWGLLGQMLTDKTAFQGGQG